MIFLNFVFIYWGVFKSGWINFNVFSVFYDFISSVGFICCSGGVDKF